MKKLTGTPKRCVFRVLLILLIVAMTVSGCAFGEQTPEPTEPASKYNNPMDLPEDMLDVLVNYLETYFWEYDMIGLSSEGKIDQIKNGA